MKLQAKGGRGLTLIDLEAKDRLLAVSCFATQLMLSGMARGLLGRQHPLQRLHRRREALKDADCVLLVGHNPGLETLVSLLTDGTSDQGRGMPPGSIAWMHVDGDASIEPGAASLRHFWWP